MSAKLKSPPAVSVLSLEDIATFTPDQAADAYGIRYTARTVAFLEMGKLVYHIETRTKMKPSETIHGIMQKRGVPTGSVSNARLVSNFITNFVIPGLVTEARLDEIGTFRIVNETNRILTGKTPAKMTPEEIAAIVNSGKKAAIGDELDCLAEHGMTIAGRIESEKKKAAEAKRTADLAAAATLAEEKAKAAAAKQAETAAKLEADRIAAEAANPTAAVETPAPVATPTAAAVETPVPVETPTAAAVETPAPVETPTAAAVETPAPVEMPTAAAPAPAAATPATATQTAGVLARIDELELQTCDLDPEGTAAVRAKLVEWLALIDNTAAMQNGTPLKQAA